MRLFADRFMVGNDDHAALDLATADRVALSVAPAGSEIEQRRWALACDAAQQTHHPTIARLVDYGMIGRSQRFEARQIIAVGSVGSVGSKGRKGRTSAPVRTPVRMPSIAIIDRPVVAAIGEVFECPSGVRPRSVTIWGPHGAGKDTIVAALACTARRQGFVPVAARLLGAFADVLRGRSLFVIDDCDTRDGWTAWLLASLSAPRPHVLLSVSIDEPSRSEGLRVEPVPVATLVQAVQPISTTAGRALAIQRYAEQSQGWPGRFARLVWGVPRPAQSPRPDTIDRQLLIAGSRSPSGDGQSTKVLLRAAEQPEVYGIPVRPATMGARAGGAWPLSSDVALWRSRLDSGALLFAGGRHARGERVLRQSIGALSRRGEWAHAGEGSLTLATLLIRRGRAQDALAVLNVAADFLRQAGDEPHLLELAVLTGTASTELGRLDHAETAVSAAAAAAQTRGDQPRAGRALAALSRTLFWRARYDEAHATLTSAACKGNPVTEPADAIVRGGLEVAIAVGLGDLRLAVSRGTESLLEAQRSADARLVAQAARSAAFAHLAVSDLAAVERDVAVSVAAARACHEPLIATRSRLILAEALRRSGRRSAASDVLQRVSRIGATHLPPIVRARCDLLRDLLVPAGEPHEIVGRHVAATGLAGLALYGPASSAPIRHQGTLDPMVSAIVGILDLCQQSDDERAVLTDVCRRLRGQLHAVGVALVAGEEAARTVMAADGSRVDQAIAGRAITAGLTLAPQRFGDRLEAAAPIRLGGAFVGALVARWTIGTPHDLASAASLMTAVAAAAAPLVSALLARARRLAIPAMADLLGASAAMAEVRRGVERAAPAPFAVLIEGESGCGKELVARALHRSGPRRDHALCTLNCAALPDDLVEAELFGHVRGAFTGAVGERTGVFEEAHGGTLLLDEIGELSPRAQAKVLRVIQDGELRRVGANSTRRIDVRIVSATNRDLRQEVAAGRFRLDLLYRLDVVRIAVPPLRDRREDIPALAEHFWREATARVGSRAVLAPETLAALGRYDWPGNVRELQNAMASLAVRAAKRGIVPPTALGPQFADQRLSDALRLEDARRTFDERFVRAALIRAGGHRRRAAAELGVTRQGLTKLMSRLGIT